LGCVSSGDWYGRSGVSVVVAVGRELSAGCGESCATDPSFLRMTCRTGGAACGLGLGGAGGGEEFVEAGL
jgi:hypothetical protein